jgi:hypothetical protein
MNTRKPYKADCPECGDETTVYPDFDENGLCGSCYLKALSKDAAAGDAEAWCRDHGVPEDQWGPIVDDARESVEERGYPTNDYYLELDGRR